MSTDRRKLLAALLRKEGMAPPKATAGIPRRPPGESLQPSIGEEQLVRWNARNPESPAYHMPFTLEVNEHLEPARLESAFKALLRRHSALRAGYVLLPDGEVAKTLATTVDFELEREDLETWPAEKAARRLAGLERSLALAPFDLTAPPLLRACLVHLPSQRSALILVLHHLIADGWSLGILCRELEQLYRGKDEESLPPLPLEYDDWAAWQRQELGGDKALENLAWWRRQLSGTALLELPIRRPRTKAAQRPSAKVELAIQLADSARLLELGRATGASPFVTVATLWATLLRGASGVSDLVIGTGMAYREPPETRQLVGFLADVLPLRLDLGGNPSFREALGRVRDALGACVAHAVPFESLIQALAPSREVGRTPFFETLLTLEGEDESATTFQLRALDNGRAKFDLSLDLKRSGDRLEGRLEYDSELFSAAAIERWAGRLIRLAAEVSSQPDRPLTGVEGMDPAELARLETLSTNQANYPRDQRVDSLFTEVASARPRAIALSCGKEELSYGALEESANRLAHHLRSLGVGPEVGVGICLERSLELIVATLAVVKAGGFYVPLDRGYPAERLAFMLEETKTRLLISQADLESELPEGAERVLLDRDAAAIAACSPSSPPSSNWPESLLYVMFTSGSTGRPKGVACTHRNVIRLVCGSSFARLENQVLLQLAPTSFDASTLEIWGALLGGGRLAIYPPGPVEPASLARCLAAEKVSTLWLTAGLFHRMVDEEPAILAKLDQLLAGGDVLSVVHVERLLERGSEHGCVLINGYGPTENTTFTTTYAMRGRQGFAGSVPIGRPIANTTAWVLDNGLQPVPIGVAGELYAGGDGLARGYFGRPALTAERFLPDPRGHGARLYRTGDQAFWNDDETLSFLGRNDGQVKIRGFRIEPGEIQSVLSTLPGVREAAVVAREERGEQQLVAYLVTADGTTAPPVPWRDLLGARLPSYMIPAAFVRLAALPLTANGKLDRRALPAPDFAEAEAVAPPIGLTEEIITAVWAQVLNLDSKKISRHDTFFALGGHSLSLTQVAARLREAFLAELPLALFFEHGPLFELAGAIDAARAATSKRSALPPIESVAEPYPPLSFAQERIYFLERLDPGLAVYNVPLAVELEGQLDPPTLQKALEDLVARHSILRTHFLQVDGQARQEVVPFFLPALPLVDLEALSTDLQVSRADAHELAEAERLFDLEAGPLFAASLVRFAADRHRLVFVQHHLITDGWSVDLLLDELFLAYAARRKGDAWTPTTPATQYADYAVWQRRWLEGTELERQLAFWRRKLEAIPTLELPTDRPRPPVRRHLGGEILVDLDAAVVTGLEALAGKTNTTVFTVFIAALRAFLARICGTTDLAIGTIVANRRLAALENMAGFCANTLVLRTPVDPWQSFAALLEAERQNALEAWDHQDLPFERLVEALAPQRDPARTPIFQVLAVLRREAAIQHRGELTIRAREIYNGTAKFDFAVALITGPDGARLGFEFSRDLFERATIASFVTAFTHLLASVVERPETRLAELAINGETPPLSRRPARRLDDLGGSLHQRFFAQAAATPEAIAVTCDGDDLTYAELEVRSRAVAATLRSAGIGPEKAVGLCLERSTELVVALVGLLAAGGAYVPLDPAAPAQRLALILEDADISVLLTQRSLRERLPQDYAGTVLIFEELPALQDKGETILPAGADHLAYIIFTSGSTGVPKGSPITHRNVLRLFTAAEEHFDFGPSDVWTLFHSYAFDFSVWELWGALLYGGRLVIVPYLVSRSPEAFYRLLVDQRVTVLNQTPSAFRQLIAAETSLLAEGEAGNLALRQVIFGGEALELTSLKPWLDRHGDANPRLINMYGITETTVHVTFRQVVASDLERSHQSPIGEPLSDLEIFLLDPGGRQVPQGVPGEIYVAGEGLGRGYLNRPRFTAERFVPHPYTTEPGARLYRSGDLAKRSAGGETVYLGRIDSQVKLRGFRIELGEINAQLAKHPAIREAVVNIRQDSVGDPVLVGYFIPLVKESAPTPAELRAHLLTCVPDYMVPAAFLALETFPLTVNGKIDLAALPEPALTLRESSGTRPASPAEELVAAIWSEVLGISTIDREADFFALGGHSLKAAQVVSRLRERLGVEIPLRTLFAAPRLEALAAAITAHHAADRSAEKLVPPPILPAPDPSARGTLSFAQQRMWFLDRLDPGSSAYLIPAVLHFSRGVDAATLAAALTHLVDRHELLRTLVLDGEDGPEAVVTPQEAWQLQIEEMAGMDPQVLATTLEAASRRPFDLATDKPLRTILYRDHTSAHLLVVIHHIAADMWSLGIFLRELATAYTALAAGEIPRLPDLPIRYSDFAHWQRQLLAGPSGERQLAFWRQYLADLPPLSLPTDRPRPTVQSHHGKRVIFHLGPELRTAIETLARNAGATPFMVLLTGFASLLGRLSGQRDFAIGMPVAGRTHAEVEPLIGLFINTLVLRADLAGAPSFKTILTRLRDSLLAAWAYQDMPFERLVDALAPQRDLGSTPFFQALFSYQNDPPAAVFKDLEVVFEPLDNGAAKLDLALSMGPSEEGFVGVLTYNTALFDAATPQRIVSAFRTLLEAATAAPHLPFSSLPLIGPEDAARIDHWNEAVPPLEIQTVPQMLARWVRERPDSEALVAGATRLDRRALMERSRRLAHYLRARGIGPESVVGLCLHRNADLIVALVGILESGAAYLPLDPDHPEARRSRLLEMAGARALVTSADLAPTTQTKDLHVVRLDADAEIIAAQKAGPLEHGVQVENLAYVLFTSGSTGEPKAVAVEQRQLAHYLAGIADRMSPEPGWRWGYVSTIAADLGHTGLFGALCFGGVLHLFERAATVDPEAFADLLEVEGIDAIKMVPSHLEALLSGSRPASVLPRRALILGGEVSSRPLLQRVRSLAPTLRLFNSYGPTETTVAATTHLFTENDGWARIGAPALNARFEVLDADLGRIPLELPGELAIGGPSVARGYLGRPALTAQRFVPDPFSGQAGARQYLTGDVVRRLPSGDLRFFGRRDHQVKIRGFRIELGEVEAALARIAGGPAVAVIDQGSDNLPRLLAAVAVGSKEAESGLGESLRAALRNELPEPMVPAKVLPLSTLPITSNGKIDRPAISHLLRNSGAPPKNAASLGDENVELRRKLADLWQDLLGVDGIGRDESFFDLGGHSLLLIRLQRRLREDLGFDVSVADLFANPTIASLAHRLAPTGAPSEKKKWGSGGAPKSNSASFTDRRIAVVGMSGRFPGADDLETFWRHLEDGVESIRGFTIEERRASGADPMDLAHPGYVDARGVIEGVEGFDAALFGFRPQQATLTDPQHRIFLECVWEALEDAGIDPERSEDAIGVFAGVGENTYYLHHLFRNPRLGEAAGSLEARYGNDKDFLPSRVAYTFDLRGPAVAVQTSCSSSLVAVHMACLSLMVGESDVVIAGGVRIAFPQYAGYLYQQGSIVSADGHCRAFDASARGTVPGNGSGVVVLKRYADALADGDRIRAVILGSATNNDGARKVGYTAPGVEGQRRAIAAALAAAGVEPSAVDYVETHGTGTQLGDPIEIAALQAAFAGTRDAPCKLGALKPNIGHLDTAAGVAGLIKTILALEREVIPPTLHFEAPNPELRLDPSLFSLSATAQAWTRRQGHPRRAGVSSFGIGGTNAHLIVEEAPLPLAAAAAPELPQLLLLSANDPAALEAATERLAVHLETRTEQGLADIAFSLAIGRRRLDHRRVVIASSKAEAAAALRSPQNRSSGRRRKDEELSLVYLFPGQGAQHPGMGRNLYERDERFRLAIDRGAEILAPHVGLDLRQLLYPAAGDEEEAAARLAQTRFTQPAIFLFETALAHLLGELGFTPAAMIGHSIGEYTAATLAGVWSFEDAAKLVATRGRLMNSLPSGAMATLELEAGELLQRLPAEISLAAENAPARTVIAGPVDAMKAFCAELEAEGISLRPLRVSHAFHSAMMDPILESFAAVVASVKANAPTLPFLSNLKGTWIEANEATDPHYWARHLRSTVQFSAGLETLLTTPGRVLLEVGPGQTLSTLARRQPAARGKMTHEGSRIIACSPPAGFRDADDQIHLLEAVGRLWLAGAEPDCAALHPGPRQRVGLPTYAFQRQRCWVEPIQVDSTASLSQPELDLRTAPAQVSNAGNETPFSPVTALHQRPSLSCEYVAPESATEIALTGIWVELFGIAPIGRFDDFFELGGDSLLATRLTGIVRERLGFSVTIATFFAAPTVAGMAANCASNPTTKEDLANLFADLEQMSSDEVDALLAKEDAADRA